MSPLSYPEQLRNDLFQAYEDARRHKRNTKAQLEFEKDAEHNLIHLYHELLDRSYKPGESICFLTYSPVLREVFASRFRDRVVHHLLFNYIAPIFEKSFIHDSYSCRKGKGTLFGIHRLAHHVRSCTDNYREKGYVLKLDIQGYFMSIDKKRLYGIIQKRLMKHWEQGGFDCGKPGKNPEFILYLVENIIFKDHTLDCKRQGNRQEWQSLPPSKSLFCQPKDVGLPIGDLTSQLFSNIYLNELDSYVKRELKVRWYGRYVDDFNLIHPSRAYLRSLIPKIKVFLKERYGLTLHPRKIYLQSIAHGVPFLGAFVKPHRIYSSPRTIKKFHAKARRIMPLCQKEELGQEELVAMRSSLNSYLGYFGHYKAYGILHRQLTGSLIFRHFYFASGYKKAIPYIRYVITRRERYKSPSDINKILIE